VIDSALAISAVALIVSVVVHLIKTGRWMGQQETERKKDHDALFDGDGNPKWDAMRDDVTWIRAKLGNGLFHDVSCLQDENKAFRERLATLEAKVGSRRDLHDGGGR
jgi:hypothetical protein